MTSEVDLIVNGISLAAVIYGLIETFKSAEWLPTKYARLAAMLLGAVGSYGVAVAPATCEWILRGLAVGVLVSTWYAGAKKGANDTGDTDSFYNYDK